MAFELISASLGDFMKKFSKLINFPVLSKINGNLLGRISDVLFDAKSLNIVGYIVSMGSIIPVSRFLKLEDIFRNYVSLLTVSDEGERIYKTIKNIDTTNFTIVGFNDWAEKIPDEVILKEVKRLVGEETALLMNEEVGKMQRIKFLKRILGDSSSIYISSIPGVVIRKFHTNKNGEDISFDSRIPFTHFAFADIISSDTIEKTPLFVHSPDSIGQPIIDIIFNAQHPLCSRLLDSEKLKNKATL
jgi:sporulation protein YlmC with PRC-barrel domain